MAKDDAAMAPARLIPFLNALTLGDVDSIAAKLAEARDACVGLNLPELANKIEEAGKALLAGDVKTYRRNVETVVARLGHLK